MTTRARAVDPALSLDQADAGSLRRRPRLLMRSTVGGGLSTDSALVPDLPDRRSPLHRVYRNAKLKRRHENRLHGAPPGHYASFRMLHCSTILMHSMCDMLAWTKKMLHSMCDMLASKKKLLHSM